MCGFTGYTGIESDNPNLIRSMTLQILHRGPDAEGYLNRDWFSLGHCRLSIIGLDENADQPRTSQDGSLVFNGEVYNWKQLATKHFPLETYTSDTQLLFSLLVKFGVKKTVPMLRGIYAFAYVDSINETISLTRDQFGTKPIYVTRMYNQMFFASEIKAFKGIYGWKPKMDREGLETYLTFQNNFGRRTIFQDVFLVAPGSTEEYSKNGVLLRTYSHFTSEEKPQKLSDKQHLENLTHLFGQAIDRNLVSDTPIGTFLSGGIDSALITAFCSEKIQSLKTFTIGFDMHNANALELNYDESKTSLEVSEYLRTSHEIVTIGPSHLESAIDRVSWSIEDPRVGQSYPNYYAAELASKHVKVALAGTGGDEIFAGYPWRYQPILQLSDPREQTQKLLEFWHRLGSFEIISQLLRKSEKQHISEATSNLKAAFTNRKLGSEKVDLNSLLKFEQETFLHGLLLVEDKLSMAHGLEVRVPFLDEDLVAYANQLPEDLKFQTQTSNLINEKLHAQNLAKEKAKINGKLALRKILNEKLPKVAGLQKQGFSAPDATWFREDYNGMVSNTLSDPSLRIWSYLDYSIAQKVIKAHFQGWANHRLLIWSLLTLESTLQQFDFASPN